VVLILTQCYAKFLYLQTLFEQISAYWMYFANTIAIFAKNKGYRC
jgi:hypothetical protein